MIQKSSRESHVIDLESGNNDRNIVNDIAETTSTQAAIKQGKSKNENENENENENNQKDGDGAPVSSENKENNKEITMAPEFVGQGLLFDMNFLEYIESSDSIGQFMFGPKIMKLLNKYFYRNRIIIFIFFGVWSTSVFICDLYIIMRGAVFNQVVNAFGLVGIAYEILVIMKMNKTVVFQVLTSFETSFLLFNMIVETFACFDQLGWAMPSVVGGLLFGLSQIVGILMEALPRPVKRFDHKWRLLMNLRHKFNQEANTSEEWFDIEKEVRDTSQWKPLLDQVRSNINHTNCHLLAYQVQRRIDWNNKWAWKTKVIWTFKIIAIFSDWMVLAGYFVAVLVSWFAYIVFLTKAAKITQNRHIEVYWMRFTMSEVFRSTCVTSIIFYTKRMITIIFHPLHISSILKSQIIVPFIPEWSLLMNHEEKEAYEMLLSEGLSKQNTDVQVNENQRIRIVQNENYQELNNLNMVPTQRQVYPIVMIPSSGRGEIIEMKRPLLSYIMKEYMKTTRWNRYFLKRNLGRIFVVWGAGISLLYVFFLNGSTSIHYASIPFFFLSFVSVCLQFMDVTATIFFKIVSGFETLFLIGNLIIFSWMASWYFPDSDGPWVLSFILLALLVVVNFIIDARPFPIHSTKRKIIDLQNHYHLSNIQQTQIGKIIQQYQCRIFLHGKCDMASSSFMNLRNAWERPNDGAASHKQIYESSIYDEDEYNHDEHDGNNQQERKLMNKVDRFVFTHSIFGNLKPLIIFMGFLPLFWLYTLVDFDLVKNVNYGQIAMGGAMWANRSLLKTGLGNMIIFLLKRLVISIMYPERCLTIQRSVLRLPLSDSVVALLV